MFSLMGKYSPVVLVGQTIGPFNRWINWQIVRRTLKSVPIITRDEWCSRYLQQELNLKQNVFHGADLAFCDLPLQSNKDIEQDILRQYGLVSNQYITVILSGHHSAYCKDRTLYLQVWQEVIQRLAAEPMLQDKKICLLAHTFHPYGDEGKNIEEVCRMLPQNIREQIIPVTERILPTRARFILGNGYLTITGRMHASVSTFQMGKPAVVLSYSKKYDGVIGSNLNRQDLILNANDSVLWESRKIPDMIGEKVRYICGNYNRLTEEIRNRAAVQKELAAYSLQKCVEFVKK
jgi:colanic acid/amylovoran biosynthesis protein